MPPAFVPTLAEIAALADRALRALDGEGIVNVLWERRLAGGQVIDRLAVTFTAVQDGRAGRAETTDVGDDHLRRAARGAVLRARQARAWPAAPLPQPAPGRAHGGFMASVLEVDPAAADADARRTAGTDFDVAWSAGAARTAVATSSGVRASEERSHVMAVIRGERPDGRAAAATVAGAGGADVAAAAAEVRALLGEGAERRPFASQVPAGIAAVRDDVRAVVLGPEAVATVLEQLRPAVGIDLALGGGPLAGRLGTRVAAPGVDLWDAADDPATLPRSYDAEGVPRRRVPLIRDGVARDQIHDCASAARAGAATTGHASQAATLAPYPDHLVLAGGAAEDVGALCAGVGRGLLIPFLSSATGTGPHGRRHTAMGAASIEHGELVGGLPPLEVQVAAVDVLAGVDALTGTCRCVAVRGHAPGGVGAAVVPALRTGAGVRVGS